MLLVLSYNSQTIFMVLRLNGLLVGILPSHQKSDTLILRLDLFEIIMALLMTALVMDASLASLTCLWMHWYLEEIFRSLGS